MAIAYTHGMTRSGAVACASAVVLALGCGGKVDVDSPLLGNDAAAARDAAASVSMDSSVGHAPADAAPSACGPALSCPMGEVCVAQVGPDGGVELTRCMTDVQCQPQPGMYTRCVCPICGSEPTIQCFYGPYYGNLTAVECRSM